MGFKLYFPNGPSDEERIADALAEIKDGLRHVDDPDVWSRGADDEFGDEQGVGLLENLERCTRGNPTWQMAMAIRTAFALGRVAITRKVDPAELAKLRAAWSRGGRNGGGGYKKRAKEAWHAKAKPIWLEYRGSRAKGDTLWKSQDDLAAIIKAEIGNAGPDHDRIVKTIRAWDREAS